MLGKKLTSYPDTPKVLTDKDTEGVNVLYCVTGINFQFYFLDKKEAKHYAETSNSFYNLPGIVKVTECKKEKEEDFA